MGKAGCTKFFQVVHAEIADTDAPHLSLLFQAGHRFQRAGQRVRWIGPVDVVQVDVVCFQAAQALFACSRHPVLVKALIDNFCRNHSAASPACQRISQNLFGTAATVALRSVEEIDSAVQCGMHGID